jgi:predicted GNAT family acetyltransferase
MGVTRYTDAQLFATAAAPMAARSDNVATIVAGWVNWLANDSPSEEEHVYLAVFANRDVEGIALRRRDFAVRIEGSDAAAVAFARDIATDRPQLQGVVGARAACEAFAREWHARTGRASALRFHLRNHLLTRVEPIAASPGRMRPATVADTQWLIASLAAFVVDARLPDDPGHAAELARKGIERDEIRIWDDGGPLAFARATTPGADIARVGPVWTAPAARGRGYATSLCAALARELIAKGRARIDLDTDMANPTSNALYARVGFRPQYDFYHFDFVEG